MIEGTLKTGDYSIEGLEQYVCMERKASPSEIAINLGKERDRFIRELVRMQDYKHKYIICEFTFDELLGFPDNAPIPKAAKASVKMTGKFMLKSLIELQIQHGFHLYFTEDKGSAFLLASSIFKRIWEQYSE